MKGSDELKLLTNYEEACKRIQMNLDKKRHRGNLYHFTSFESLKNILVTKSLWHTNYKCFNDPNEIIYGQDIIKLILKSKTTQKNSAVLHKFMDYISSNFDNLFKIYVACFAVTEKKLALWRYYANEGTGFAIGFNPNFYHLATPSSSNLGKAVIAQVSYGANIIRKPIIKLINEYLKVLSNARKKMDSSAYDYFSRKAQTILATHLITFFPCIKHPSFDDEHEVRLFYTEGEGMRDPKTNVAFYFPETVRKSIDLPKEIYPFVNDAETKKHVIFPEEFLATDISEIWIGPRCDYEEASSAINKILENNGFDVKKVSVKKIGLALK
jgi:hypothetical protein